LLLLAKEDFSKRDQNFLLLIFILGRSNNFSEHQVNVLVYRGLNLSHSIFSCCVLIFSKNIAAMVES
jgi:hypothetical protein